MVGRQSQAVRAASSPLAPGPGWVAACANRSKLSAKAISVECSTVHPTSAREPAGGVELFRESGAFIPAPVHRLDRFRQARGNENQAAAGGHRSARGGKETWLEMMCRPTGCRSRAPRRYSDARPHYLTCTSLLAAASLPSRASCATARAE